MKITACIFDSFVCDSGILDPCKDGICLWMTWHGERNILQSLQKHFPWRPHRHHWVVSLSKNINPSFVLVHHRKTHPFITERLLMGRKEPIQTKFPIKNSTWGTEKCVAVFAKAFPINLFDILIKTHLTTTKIWWLVTSILKVTVCILDSFSLYIWQLCLWFWASLILAFFVWL